MVRKILWWWLKAHCIVLMTCSNEEQCCDDWVPKLWASHVLLAWEQDAYLQGLMCFKFLLTVECAVKCGMWCRWTPKCIWLWRFWLIWFTDNDKFKQLSLSMLVSRLICTVIGCKPQCTLTSKRWRGWAGKCNAEADLNINCHRTCLGAILSKCAHRDVILYSPILIMKSQTSH